jgi:hypothetical protein
MKENFINWLTWDIDAAQLVGDDATRLDHTNENVNARTKFNICKERHLTLVVPQPETVTMVPAGGSNSEVGGGRRTGLASATLKSNGASNYARSTRK